MIVGVGTDIVEVGRLERGYERHRRRLLERLFTPREIAYCEGQAHPFESYAARFAAKEAFLKALGSCTRDGIAWPHMEVVRDGRGPPALALTGQALDAIRARGVANVFLSLSHTREYGVAVVVLER